MRTLLTGAAGYIGSYLLHNWKTDITAVDNFHTQRYCSLFNLPRSINFVESSFQDLSIDFLRQFDTVIHLAAIVDASKSFDNEVLVKQVNVDDTIDFIDKCTLAKVQKFIFPSSTSIYGLSQDDTPIKEFDEGTINPQSPYADGKFEVEKYLRKDIQRDMDYMILRFGTICGWSPGWRNQTAVNKFCFNSIMRKPLPVWTEALNFYRPYLCLTDCLEVVHICATYSKYKNETLNILTKNYTLKRILSMLSVQKYFDIEWVDSPLINQYNYKVSSSKMRKLFAFPNFGAKDYYDPRIYHKRLLPQGSVYECIEETLKALRNINL